MRAIALILALAAGAAAAQPAHMISMPDWAQTPVGADLAAAYPPQALRAGVAGDATIACLTREDGVLSDCRVVAETPAGAGFGAAALKLSERFRMKPITRDGQPVAGGQVTIPIRFSPGPPPGAASRPSVVTTSE